MTESLFSYGTLQDEPVQLSTFGRKLTGIEDLLPGYELSLIEIDDPQIVAISGATHHPIIRHTGLATDAVKGTVFEVTSTELQQADEYEVGAYIRVGVVVASGKFAWVYVNAIDGGKT
jgi:hypothetical protein